MVSKIVKCASCNVVINEVLAFICNKLDVMNEQSISQICASAFDDSEILASKNLLFDSMSKTRRKKIRRRHGKTLRDIDDIICVLKETDPEDIPTFVARDLHRLPPVLFDHVDVTRLLKDLVLMRGEMQRICDEYVTVKQFEELELEIKELRNASIVNNVTLKRGVGRTRLSSFEYESGPLALSPQHTILPTEGSVKTPCGIYNGRPLEHKLAGSKPSDDRQSPPPPAPSVSHPTPPLVPATAVHIDPPNENNRCAIAKKSFSDVLHEGEWKSQKQDEKWNLVQRKRLQNRFVGKTGNATVDADSKFKAADSKVPLYIYNVSKDASVCDIITYVRSKTNIDVRLEKMNMKSMKDYDAYKVYVPKCKLDTFLTDDFWPEGVIYRPFVELSRRTASMKYRDLAN